MHSLQCNVQTSSIAPPVRRVLIHRKDDQGERQRCRVRGWLPDALIQHLLRHRQCSSHQVDSPYQPLDLLAPLTPRSCAITSRTSSPGDHQGRIAGITVKGSDPHQEVDRLWCRPVALGTIKGDRSRVAWIGARWIPLVATWRARRLSAGFRHQLEGGHSNTPSLWTSD